MILIRVDANSEIGTGHVMRCITLAQAFRGIGQACVFVTADHSADVLIRQNGFDSVSLNSTWNDMSTEIETISSLLLRNRPELMLVDSYFVSPQYHSALPHVCPMVYIDDLAEQVLPVDALVNYNIYAQKCNYSGYDGDKTHLLLGPCYAPLREEFKEKIVHNHRDDVKDILVSAGGSDPLMVTEQIMLGLCAKPRWQQIRFHFVVGALNPRLGVIRQASAELKNVVLHINETHMANLMRSCDIAISAAGSTLYELCACGVPTITYTLADNQLMAADEFDQRGIMLNIGDIRDNERFLDCLEANMDVLCADIAMRERMSNWMITIVDGNGANRLAKELLDYRSVMVEGKWDIQ